jgi:hypothetical protein
LFLSYRFKQGQTYTNWGHRFGGHTTFVGFCFSYNNIL